MPTNSRMDKLWYIHTMGHYKENKKTDYGTCNSIEESDKNNDEQNSNIRAYTGTV